MRTIVQAIQRERGAALMGVLNLTPDSFFDGGRYDASGAGERRIRELVEQGSDIIDIGGESTRPGAEPIPAGEQIRRIEAAVRYASGLQGVLVSIDTTSPEVADRMLSLGAHIINDVSCVADPDLARVVARHAASIVVMHARGPMTQMAGFSQYPQRGYEDVVMDVRREWLAARERAMSAGVAREDVWFDPGLGFQKNAGHSFELLARLEQFRELDTPIVVGPSRKSFISKVHRGGPETRLGGTIAACLAALERGASVLRIHDVFDVQQALAVARAVGSGPAGASHA